MGGHGVFRAIYSPCTHTLAYSLVGKEYSGFDVSPDCLRVPKFDVIVRWYHAITGRFSHGRAAGNGDLLGSRS